MNRLSKASIIKGRSLSFSQDTVFEGYALSYPVHAVKRCHYEVKVTKVGDYAQAAYQITADLLVEDARDAALFAYPVRFEEEVDLLDSEDSEGEGYIVEGKDIDLEEIALKLILSSLPLKLVRKKSSLPQSGKGYRVLSQDDYEKEKAEEGNPAFSGLKEFKPKKD